MTITRILPIVTFGKRHSQMGQILVPVFLNGERCPLFLKRGISGWSLVFRREMLSPSRGSLTLGEQVLSSQMPLSKAKTVALNRVMEKGCEPDSQAPFMLATMERVMSEEA